MPKGDCYKKSEVVFAIYFSEIVACRLMHFGRYTDAFYL